MGLVENAFRGTWREWLRLRYWRARRRRGMSNGPVLERVAGRSVVVLPGVFHPSLLRSGAFLAERLDEGLVPPGARVLELGTGTGLVALTAARWAGRVIATDINPVAVRAARINVLLHDLESKVEVREGDLFDPVEAERFDVVIFNPPYFRGEPRDALDMAWRSPDLDRRFAQGLASHLAPEGSALVCLSTDGELDFVQCLESAGHAVDVVAERDLLNEVLRLYRVRPKPASR